MVLAIAGLAVACGDDDDDDNVASDGGKDSGTDAGRVDAGGIDSGAPVVSCGTPAVTCTGFSLASGTVLAPACAKNWADAEVCGLSTAALGGTDAGLPSALEKDAPGAASASCGAFYDSLEPASDAGTKGNGRIDTKVSVGTMSYPISYPGCCTKKGWCSGDTNNGLLFGTTATSGGYGCMESTAFFKDLPAQVQKIKCDVATGVLVPPSADAGTGVADAGGIDAGH
jgi:hypothetical protein